MAFSELVTQLYGFVDPLLDSVTLHRAYADILLPLLQGRMGTAISSEPTAAFAAFGLLNFGKGVGNVLSGPISGALLSKTINVHAYGAAKYKPMVLFTGSSMALSSVVVLLPYLRLLKAGRNQNIG
jgi:hypothetical protein